MNLSSYLQMPPAPLASNNTQNAVPQGARSGVGSSVNTGLGFDFAQVMAQQIKHLAPHERQTFAADAPKAPAQPEQNTHVQEKRTEKNDRASDETDNEEDKQETQAGRSRHRTKTNNAKAAPVEADALLEELMQGAPLVTSPTQAMNLAALSGQAATTAPTAAVTPNGETAAPLATATTLQTIELSPQVRIITDTKQTPSPESLAAFAKSMGLDESAIQNLLGAGQTAANAAATETAPAAAGATLANANMNSALANMAKPLPTADSAVATQLAAMNVAIDTPLTTNMPVASGAGLAAAATTLVAPTVAGLSPTDMAAIQQLQITVLPPAVMPVNAPALANNTANVSTMDMLSLLGTGIDERDVNALVTQFSEQASGDSDNGAQQQTQQDTPEGGAFSSFSQALNRNSASNAPTATAAAQATHMGEVYDQLSDKMATEMAARMHKQLSDGEWKMKFALRPSNLGGVEIQLEMKDGKLDAVFRADNPLTRDLLQNSSQRLREALGNFGINAGQVNVGQSGGNSTQNGSGNSGKQSQVRDNSSSQVSGTGSASSTTSTRNKANASLLDLYA